MKNEFLSYFMDSNYKVLLEKDISDHNLMAFRTNNVKINYMSNNIVIIIADDGSNRIINKYTVDDDNHRKAYGTLPSEIDYDFRGNILQVKYEPSRTNGEPDIILSNYAANNILLENKYYWNDNKGFTRNDYFNKFLNEFFIEKVFDITFDYDHSDVIKDIIASLIAGKESELRSIFNQLNIKSLDHIQQEYATLIEILQQ